MNYVVDLKYVTSLSRYFYLEVRFRRNNLLVSFEISNKTLSIIKKKKRSRYKILKLEYKKEKC